VLGSVPPPQPAGVPSGRFCRYGRYAAALDQTVCPKTFYVTVFCGFQRCVWGILDRSKRFCLWGAVCAIVTAMIRRIAIYARCSTEEQTTENPDPRAAPRRQSPWLGSRRV
jgi:hypothetical protein